MKLEITIQLEPNFTGKTENTIKACLLILIPTALQLQPVVVMSN